MVNGTAPGPDPRLGNHILMTLLHRFVAAAGGVSVIKINEIPQNSGLNLRIDNSSGQPVAIVEIVQPKPKSSIVQAPAAALDKLRPIGAKT
jgi:hypothetical protein